MGRDIYAREMRFGRYYEEFELGDTYHHWPGKTITEADDHGDTIYARTTVLEKRESRTKPDRGIVAVETFGWNQRDETVCEFRRRVLVPKRPAGA